MPNGGPHLTTTANCPCSQRARLNPAFEDPDTTQPVPANGNALCIHCGRVLRTNAGAIPRRACFTDEAPPPGLLVASRARGQGLRGGRPFDNAPPRDPKDRPPHVPPGNPD